MKSRYLVKGISKNNFCDFLNLATKELFFMLNNKFYIQVHGIAMGSPLVPLLANIFLWHHEENWLNKCPIEYKPSFYRRYVDWIFALFESFESASWFRDYISSKHQNINFTIKICFKNDKFVTGAYKKSNLVEFSPIMKASFPRTKSEDFYTH